MCVLFLREGNALMKKKQNGAGQTSTLAPAFLDHEKSQLNIWRALAPILESKPLSDLRILPIRERIRESGLQMWIFNFAWSAQSAHGPANDAKPNFGSSGSEAGFRPPEEKREMGSIRAHRPARVDYCPRNPHSPACGLHGNLRNFPHKRPASD